MPSEKGFESSDADELLAGHAQTLMKGSDWDGAKELLEPRLSTPMRNSRLLSASITCFRNTRNAEMLQKIYQNLADQGQVEVAGKYITSGLSFIGQRAINPHREFVFVSGAPRSGTTSFGRMLNLHDEVAMLVERFTPYFGYHPDMFLEQSIFSPGSQNHRHAPKIRKLRPKLKKARWIGDKRPNFAFGAAITKQHFADCEIRVFHILRDIRDVCWSYEGKAKRSIDDWGYQQACFDFNYNNRALLNATKDCPEGFKVFSVDYRKLHSDVEYATNVFERLNVEIDSSFKGRLADYIDESARVLNKTRNLSPEINQYIDANVDWSAEKALSKFSLT